MYAGPYAFASRDSDGDAKHDGKKEGNGKGDFVDGNVAGHLHAIIANFQVDACGVEVAKHILQLFLNPEKETQKNCQQFQKILSFSIYDGMRSEAMQLEAKTKRSE